MTVMRASPRRWPHRAACSRRVLGIAPPRQLAAPGPRSEGSRQAHPTTVAPRSTCRRPRGSRPARCSRMSDGSPASLPLALPTPSPFQGEGRGEGRARSPASAGSRAPLYLLAVPGRERVSIIGSRPRPARGRRFAPRRRWRRPALGCLRRARRHPSTFSRPAGAHHEERRSGIPSPGARCRPRVRKAWS